MSAGKILIMILFFFSIRYEKVHPLEAGYFRLKYREDRRPRLRTEVYAFFLIRALPSKTLRSHFWMAYWLLRDGCYAPTREPR